MINEYEFEYRKPAVVIANIATVYDNDEEKKMAMIMTEAN